MEEVEENTQVNMDDLDALMKDYDPDACEKYIKHMDAHGQYEAEIKALKKKSLQEKAKADVFKTQIMRDYEQLGLFPEHELLSIRVSEQETYVIDDADQLPEKYLRIRETVLPNKELIRKDFGNGINIDGVSSAKKPPELVYKR